MYGQTNQPFSPQTSLPMNNQHNQPMMWYSPGQNVAVFPTTQSSMPMAAFPLQMQTQLPAQQFNVQGPPASSISGAAPTSNTQNSSDLLSFNF